MALTLHTIFTTKNPTPSHSPPSPSLFSKSPNFTFPLPNSRTHFPNQRFIALQPRLFAASRVSDSFQEAYESSQQQTNGNGGANIDAFLSVVEFISLVSSAAVCVYVAVRCGLPKGGGLGWLGSRILVWQCVVLVSGLAAGAAIRRRQWSRICGVGLSRGPPSSPAVNLLERVEKLEEDFRGASTIVQALSRRLEKLGIRFRLTRKSLKEPIAQTAVLVQKNSEATQALAAQEDILEKELGEIQKVLLSMQEQQRKQLDIILAIGKAGKLWDSKQVKTQDRKAPEAPKPVAESSNSEISQIETMAWQKEGNNDRP